MDGDEPVKELIAILERISEYNSSGNSPRCSLSTCHVSNEEKFGILKYVRKRGLNVDVVMDHVTQELTNVTPQEAQEMIDLGAYLEFAETSCVPWPGMQDWVIAFDYSFNLIKEQIKEKGPDHLVLITDAGQPGNEPVSGWKAFLKTLLAQGVSEEDINTMAKEVPAKLLGI
jgi:predicted metal-dependent phosphotriesterase family hydrolase